ncbi:MAG: putative spore coat protein late developmental [Gammaproteobacteria bacterium]|nr:putative spore coat protein late developmental [Gammaproteobacteria bacterium]
MNIRNSVRMTMLAASVVAAAGPGVDAVAATAPGTLSVTASVANNCTITTNAVAFGAYDPVGANASGGSNLTATGALLVTCTKNDSITLDFDSGANGSGNPLAPARSMHSGTDMLAYSLFWPSAAGAGGTATATPWGTGASSSFVYSATGNQDTINVFGSVAKAQNVPAGSYADTVNVTVNY